MKITFVGATHEVTGSCYFLEAAGKKFLVDCGMEQGPDNFENIPIPVPASELDFVLLTHAHIDHSGKLPVLYAEGFRGNIYTTYATVDLCEIMLRDSAHIQMFEAEWRNREQSLIWWDAHISRSWNWLTGFRYGSWMPVTCWVQQASNCG